MKINLYIKKNTLRNWLIKYQVKERRTKLRKNIANVNWPIVRDDLYGFLYAFLNKYPAIFSEFTVDKTDINEVGWGFDSLQVTQCDRYVGAGKWEIEGEQKILSYYKDYGVVLDINHSTTGRIQVFLRRKDKCELSSIKHINLLLFVTDDPLSLTDEKVLSFIEIMLFYAQSTSIDRRLTMCDKLRLAYLSIRSNMRIRSMSSYIYDLIFKSAFILVAVATLFATIF